MISEIYLCPADKKYGCSWEGSSDDILEHFNQEHEDLLFFTGSINIILDEVSENYLLFIDTEIYLLQIKINEDHLNIYLRYLGPAKIASKLTYDIDLTANHSKMAKQNIEMRNGYFSVALECIHTCFGDVNAINCELLVSGDFSSNSSNESVLVQDGSISIEGQEVEHNQGPESFKDSTPNLQDLFSTPVEGNSPIEPRENELNLNEISRATWYGNEINPPKERSTLLSRSHTFTFEDIKRNSAIRRQASMRSLGAIAESDLDSELKCFNCDKHLAPPIFLCTTGHNICATCYRENKICSLCYSEITSDRNQDLEEKSDNYFYTCTNAKNGCTKKLSYAEIGDHEINCIFCQYLCPMEECGYKSGFKNMIGHLNLIHSSVKMFQSFIAVFQKYQELFLVNETMGIFYCSWTQLENTVLWKAKFSGPKARKFFCELKFKGKNFKKPLLLTKHDDHYFKEMTVAELKDQKVKAKHSILTITR